MLIVLRLPVADLYRAVVDDGRGRELVLECRRKDERLECRTRLALGHRRAVELVGAAAADHRLDVARVRVDGDERALRLHDTVGILAAIRQALHRLLGGALHVHVDGRVDLQAVLVDSVRAVLVDELLGDVVDEVRGLALVLRLRVGLDEVELLILGLLGRGRVEVAVLDHLVEHGRLALLRRLQVVERRIVIRALRDAGEHRALVEREVLDILAEVRARRGLHAVGALAEVDLVEVELQDLRLRVLMLEPEGQEDFLDLALQRAVLRQVGVLGQLLRDGRAAL